jgi:hypothetical protein
MLVQMGRWRLQLSGKWLDLQRSSAWNRTFGELVATSLPMFCTFGPFGLSLSLTLEGHRPLVHTLLSVATLRWRDTG